MLVRERVALSRDHQALGERALEGAEGEAGVADPLEVLERVWGYRSFRPYQRAAIDTALARRDGLVVLPTGGGKSICYQLPAACGVGLVLCVSPLIALMDDQVAGARQVGLRAGALHSHVDPADRGRIFREARSGALQLLYASPERVVGSDLIDAVAPRLGLLAIDEAHCVSHWGHDFRPEYRQLREVLDRAPHAARLALTATATPAVQTDIASQLGLRDPVHLVGHPDRPNLVYRAQLRGDAFQQVLQVCRRHPQEAGIVYVQTRRGVSKLADRLQAAGVKAAPYHAGLDPQERQRAQDAFLAEEMDVVVATIAFGMGIDRSNVRFVVHANAPKSIEHYQQESGRAGRDGLPAECVLLFAASDLQMYRRLVLSGDEPLSPERERAFERQLADVSRYAVAPVCRHRLLCEHFGQRYPAPAAEVGAEQVGAGVGAEQGGAAAIDDVGEREVGADSGCGACDVCLGETVELDAEEARLIAQKVLSAVYRTGSRFGAGHVTQVLRGGVSARIQSLRHDQLSVYGLLSEAPNRTVRAWLDQLVAQGQLAVVEQNGFPILQLSPEGVATLRGTGTPRLSRFARPKSRSRGGRAARDRDRTELEASAWEGVDEELFERLRTLRRLLAAKARVPAYRVFGDVTLRGLAREKPQTDAAMLEVKGVGDAKLRRYGEVFLRVIAGEDPGSWP